MSSQDSSESGYFWSLSGFRQQPRPFTKVTVELSCPLISSGGRQVSLSLRSKELIMHVVSLSGPNGRAEFSLSTSDNSFLCSFVFYPVIAFTDFVIMLREKRFYHIEFLLPDYYEPLGHCDPCELSCIPFFSL